MKKRLYILAGIVTAFTTSIIVYFYLPVSVTIYEQPNDGNLKPFGEITAQNPLEQCLQFDNKEYPMTDGASLELKILAATYNRANTGYYRFSFFTVRNGQKEFISHQDIGSKNIADNKYASFHVSDFQFVTNHLCYSLMTEDAMQGNAITVWLNGQNEPVLKMEAKTNIQNLAEHLARKNHFKFGKEVISGLFFIYLLGLTFFTVFVFSHTYEQKEISKPSHH